MPHTTRIEEFEGTLDLDIATLREMVTTWCDDIVASDEGIYLAVEEQMRARDVEVDLAQVGYTVEATEVDLDSGTVSWKAYLTIEEREDDYLSDSWSMFSAEGDALVDTTARAFKALVSAGAMTCEEAVRLTQTHVSAAGHKEVGDTAVREVLWGFIEDDMDPVA